LPAHTGKVKSLHLYLLLGVVGVILLKPPANAQPSEIASPLGLSGFADVVYASIPDSGSNGHFDLGQLELDLSYHFNERVRSDLAIAYNDRVFGVGVITIGFVIGEVTEIHVGQFDVPFGIDLNFYPSPERKLISPPLVVEKTHNLWNDIGLQFCSGWRNLGLVLFAVNGLAGAEVSVVPGGRAFYSPVDLLEFGASIGIGLADEIESEAILLGGDFQLSYKNLYLKGEYIEHAYERTTDSKTTAGFYLQATVDVRPFFFCARYGGLDSEVPSLDELDRVTLGAGYRVIEEVELRGEYQLYGSDWMEDLILLQTVARF
jgi:hypothetical protein